MSILRAIALIAVVLSLLSIATDLVSKYNNGIAENQETLTRAANGESSFGVYGDWGDPRPLKRIALVILSFFNFLILRKSSNWLAALISGTSFLILIQWFLSDWRMIRTDWELYGSRSLSELLSLAANPFDYLLFAVISVLFALQTFSLFRSFFARSRSLQ